MSESKLIKLLNSRAKQRLSCTTNLTQIDKIKTDKEATVVYSFEDSCTKEMIKKNPKKYKNMTADSIQEVNFIYEGGWKIDNTTLRPNKP